MRMRGLLLLLALAAASCSGNSECSINADCPAVTCQCPVVYQNCHAGVCDKTCPVAGGTQAGQSCGVDCQCASGNCGIDTGLCCAPLAPGAGGMGTSCQHDCDCISVHCNGTSCQ